MQNAMAVQTGAANPHGRSGADFDELLRTGQSAVLAQAGRFGALKKTLTKGGTAIALAALLMVGVAPPEAHADSTMERIAKDALGGAGGAALFGQFGKGRGRDAFRLIGAVAGVAAAEALQRPQQTYTVTASPTQGFSMQQQGGAAPMQYANNGNGALIGGVEPLAPEKREKIAAQERGAFAARDTYARSLYTLQQAEEGQVLNPRSKTATQDVANANSAAQAALQQYATARSDYMNACEFMAKRGYDMHEFAYNYSLLQRQVTAKDMNTRDLAAVEVPQTGLRNSY